MECAVDLEKRPLKSAQTVAFLVIALINLWVMCAGYTDLRGIVKRAEPQVICPGSHLLHGMRQLAHAKCFCSRGTDTGSDAVLLPEAGVALQPELPWTRTVKQSSTCWQAVLLLLLHHLLGVVCCSLSVGSWCGIASACGLRICRPHAY